MLRSLIQPEYRQELHKSMCIHIRGYMEVMFIIMLVYESVITPRSYTVATSYQHCTTIAVFYKVLHRSHNYITICYLFDSYRMFMIYFQLKNAANFCRHTMVKAPIGKIVTGSAKTLHVHVFYIPSLKQL